jgi:thiol-disulfide isomerase/thioredoxin
MKNKQVMIGAAILFVIGAVAGNYAVKMWRQPPEPSTQSKSLIGTHLPAYSLLGLDGVREDGHQWLGKVQVINFWATWCPPCKREIPELIKLQHDYRNNNLQIIGIALDDAESVRKYEQEAGINFNYPILVGQDDVIKVSEKLGNDMGILPYTVITDQAGNISYIKYGEVDRETVENEIKRLF